MTPTPTTGSMLNATIRRDLDIAALLRFRDAMTPEMWELASALLAGDYDRIRRANSEHQDQVALALDTLRAALTKEEP